MTSFQDALQIDYPYKFLRLKQSLLPSSRASFASCGQSSIINKPRDCLLKLWLIHATINLLSTHADTPHLTWSIFIIILELNGRLNDNAST